MYKRQRCRAVQRVLLPALDGPLTTIAVARLGEDMMRADGSVRRVWPIRVVA